MNKLSISILTTLVISSCASITTDEKLSMYETKCVPYLDKVVQRKMGDDKSPENQEKWESVIFKDYNIAKDMNNSEQVRDQAISKASQSCNVQMDLGI